MKTCGKICSYLYWGHTLKNIDERLIKWCLCDVYVFFFFYKSICFGYSFELYRKVDAIQMGTHNICLYKVDKKYTSCNLKITELLGCALIGVCAINQSHTVIWNIKKCAIKCIVKATLSVLDKTFSRQHFEAVFLFNEGLTFYANCFRRRKLVRNVEAYSLG